MQNKTRFGPNPFTVLCMFYTVLLHKKRRVLCFIDNAMSANMSIYDFTVFCATYRFDRFDVGKKPIEDTAQYVRIQANIRLFS